VTGRCREVMPLTVTLRPPATAVHRVLDRVRHPAANHCRTGAGRQWRAGRASVVVRARPTHVGDVLDVSAPAGDFVVESSSELLLLASAGAGITTVLPIVEHIARTQPQRKVIVAHADQTAQDHALRTTVLHVGRQIDDFTSYTWYESVDPEDDESRQGLMDLSDVPLPDDVQVFTCGPLPFMRHVRSTLLTRGVPASRIRYEVFGPDLWAVQAPAEPASP
jgi:nitric oxide dioxygenase